MQKIEKIKEKEAKELAKWRKEANRKPYTGYLGVMIAILSLIRLLDEFATSAPSSIQSWLVKEFFVTGMGKSFDEGLATLSLITTVLLIFSILAVIYTALCDRVGRKIILIISVFGMALGMFTCFLSTNLMVHIVGRAILTFFIATDVHQIYVMEIVPANKRATYLQLTGVFGAVGVMLVGLSRIMYTVDGVLQWRGVFIIPSIVGLIAGILLILRSRETDTFINSKIAYLEKPYEQRQLEAEKAKVDKASEASKTGIIASYKYIFTHKQTRNIFLAFIPQTLAIMAFASYFESIMSTSGMSTDAISQALFISPISGIIVAVFAGYMADKFGRRPTGIILSITSFLTFFIFIWSAKTAINPYLVGLILGLNTAAFWRYGETVGLSFKESIPTNIRASSGAAMGLISVFIAFASGIAFSILLANINVTTLCLVWGAITLGLSAFLFFVLVKETKGIDLDSIV